jgi:hypothetical protein
MSNLPESILEKAKTGLENSQQQGSKQTLVSYYWSKEGEKAWKDIGLVYPKTVFDVNYELYLEKTRHSPEELNLAMIHNLRRVLTGDGKEFLVFDFYELRCDNLGNEKHHYKSNVGMYSIPIPQYRMVEDAEGYKEKKAVGTVGVRTGYSIPFTKENVEKLVKKGWFVFDDPQELSKRNAKRLEAAAKHKAAVRDLTASIGYTHLMVQREGDQRKYSVLDFQSFLNGNFEDLKMFGKIPTDKERADRLAAQEVANAQRSLATTDADIAAELDRAKDRMAKGIPYK